MGSWWIVVVAPLQPQMLGTPFRPLPWLLTVALSFRSLSTLTEGDVQGSGMSAPVTDGDEGSFRNARKSIGCELFSPLDGVPSRECASSSGILLYKYQWR